MLVFLDTNVLVYAALQPDPRSERARDLLAAGGIVSVQVLNEFTNVASRKLRRPWHEIAEAIRLIELVCPDIRPVTTATHGLALRLAERTGYAFYDALILAAALEAGCDMLLTEDMQASQVIDGRLTIRNPFA